MMSSDADSIESNATETNTEDEAHLPISTDEVKGDMDINNDDESVAEIETGPISVYAASVRHGYIQQGSSSSFRPSSEIRSRRWQAPGPETPKISAVGTYARYYRYENDASNSVEKNMSETKIEADRGSSDASEGSISGDDYGDDDEEEYHPREQGELGIKGLGASRKKNLTEHDSVLDGSVESVMEESKIQEDGEEETFVNEALLPDINDLYFPYGENSIFGRAGFGVGMQTGSSNALKSWLPDLMSTVPADSQTNKKARSKHQSRIDEIINGVPAKFIRNADSGLLSLLVLEKDKSDPPNRLRSADYAYIQITDPYEKRNKLFRKLIGDDFYENDCDNEQKKDELFVGMETGADPVESLPELTFEWNAKNEDTTMEILKFLLDICKEKKVNDEYKGDAWWMEGLPDVKIKAEDILQVNFDASQNSNDNIIKSGEKRDTKIHNVQPNDDDSLEEGEDLDWDNRLWEAATQHYHKAYSSEESVLELSQHQVSEFYSFMVTCLAVYAKVFHAASWGEESQGGEEKLRSQLQVPEYVPIEIAKVLFKDVTHACFENLKKSDAYDAYINGSFSVLDIPLNRNEDEVYVSALYDALFGHHLGCFHVYDVELARNTGKSALELRKRKYQVKKSEEEIHDRALVDEYLYDSVPEENALFDRNEVAVPIETDLKKSVEQEIKMKTSMTANIREYFDLEFNERGYDTLVPNLLERLLLNAEEKIENAIKNDIAVPKLPLALATMYASKYTIIYMLRYTLDRNEDIMLGSESEDNTVSSVEKLERSRELLLNASFIRLRIRFYGSFVAIRDHVRDWLMVSTTQIQEESFSGISNGRMYYSDGSRKRYCLIHEKLDNELKRTLDSILGDIAEIEEERRNDSSSSEEVAVASYASRLIDNVYRLLEVGRCSYQLGLNIGKSEDLYEGHGTLMKAASDLEASNYDVAVKSYKQACAVLHSCTRMVESLNADIQPEETPKLQSKYNDIRNLKTSTDLHLADTLIAMGYCYDVKLVDSNRAMTSYREALKLYKQLGNNHSVVIDALQNLGSVHFERENYNDSLRCYKHRLRVLQKIDKECMKKNKSKNNKKHRDQDSIVRVQGEICFTIQSIARVYVKLEKKHQAMKQYTECIKRMKDFKQNHSNNLSRSLCPMTFLDENLCELSELYTQRATELFEIWTEQGLSDMFGPKPTSNVEPYNFEFSAALDIERKALNCLDESLHMRIGSKDYEGSNDQRYDFRLLSDSMSQLQSQEFAHFQSDLTQSGILKFCHRQYKEAELDFLFVLHTYLLDVNDFEELPLRQLLDKISNESYFPNISSDSDKILSILFKLGTLYTRVRNLDDSVFCLELALRLCTERFSASNEKSPGEKVGIQLDLADVHRNLGFVYLQKGEPKLATSNFRTAARLLDRIISNPSDYMESDADEFVLEIHVKLSIVIVLNYLGRVYDQNVETLERGLVCFEDSMIILEDVLDEFKQDGTLFQQMHSISRISKGSVLQQRFSLLSLGRILGDNYYRAGKIYMQTSLHVDAELAFHRSINIFDVLKDEQYFLRDDGIIEDHDSDSLHLDLLDACRRALRLVQTKYISKRSYYTHIDDDNEDELSYSIEDLLFRIGNCHGEMGEYDKALKFLYNARKRTKEVLGSQNFVVASILHNIGSVQRSKFFETGDDGARYRSIHAFQEAVYISREYEGQYELFSADSMYRVVEMKMVQQTLSTSEAHILASDDDILEYLESALRIQLQYHGGFHADVALTKYLLGKVYFYRYDLQKSIQLLDQALSQWSSLFTSVNLDIFDAIYFRGLCHQHIASTIEDNQARKRELEISAKYFQSAIHHCNKFYTTAAITILPDSVLRKACVVQSIQCVVQFIAVNEINSTWEESLRYYLKVLSIVYNVMAHFEKNKKTNVDNLRALAAKVWMRIAIIYQHLRQIAATKNSMVTAVELYSSLSSKDTTYLLDETIFSLLLAREQMNSVKGKISLDSWREISVNIVELCGKNSPEAASVLMYIGTVSDSAHASRYFRQSRELFEEQNFDVSLPTTSVFGQRGILYKHFACISIRQKKYREAMEYMFKAIPIIEKVRQMPRAYQILPETLEDAFSDMEDWDVVLLECYILCLQLSCSLLEKSSLELHAADGLNRIAFLLGDAEHVEESFQCFYSLLLHSIHTHGYEHANVANFLFNMGDISSKTGFLSESIICFEEFYRMTSKILGNDLTLLPCIITLCSETYKNGHCAKAMKWADIGLRSLRDTTQFENEAMKLIALKSLALMKFGKLSPARRLLEKARDGMAPTNSAAIDIYRALGEVHSSLLNPKGARSQLYECLIHQQDCGETFAEILAIGKLVVNHGFLEEGRKYYTHALRKATIQYGSDHKFVADSLFGLARSLEEISPESAQKHMHEAIRIYSLHELSEDLARVQAHLGAFFRNDCHVDVALKYFVEALNILDSKRGDIVLHSNILQSVASLSYNQKDYTSASRYFERFIKFAKRIDGIEYKMSKSLYMLGCAYFFIGRYNTADKRFEDALKILNGDGKEKDFVMISLTRLAQSRNYLRIEKPVEAKWCVNEALRQTKSFKKSFSEDELVESYYLAGEIFRSLKDYRKSIENTIKALKLGEKRNGEKKLTLFLDVQIQLIALYFEVGEYGMVQEHAQKLFMQTPAQLQNPDYCSKISFVRGVCGDVERNIGNIDTAAIHYEKSISLMNEKHTIDSCEVMLKLAKCKRRKSQFSNALQGLVQAEEVSSFMHNSTDIMIRVRLERATIFFDQKKVDDALSIYSSIIGDLKNPNFDTLSRLGLHPSEIIEICTQIGLSLKEQVTLSLVYFEKAVDICSFHQVDDKMLSEQALPRLVKAHQILSEKCKDEMLCGGDSKNLDSVQRNLGKTYICAKMFKRAISIFEDFLENQLNSDDLPQLSSTLHNIGTCYFEMGNMRKAVPILERTLKIGKAVLGYNHVHVADTSFTLARAYEISSNIEASISHCQETLKIRLDTYTMECVEVIQTMQVMGMTLVAADRIEGAINVFHDALRIQKRLLHQRDQFLCTFTHFYIAQAYLSNESAQMALKHLNLFMQSPYKRTFGKQTEVATALYQIGKIYQIRGKKTRSEDYFDKCMAEIHAQFGITIFNRSGQTSTKTTSLLALLLRAQTVFVDQHLKFADLTFLCGVLLKEGYLYSESIICLDLAYDTYQKILEPSSLRLGESLLEKGRVCFELKEYMDASLFLEKVRTLWTDSSSPKSSNKVVEVTRLLGFCAHKLGQTEKSLEYLKQVASKRKKLPRKSLYYHEDTNALFAMGILRHEQNEIGSALDLYKRCHQLFKSVNCGKSRRSMLEVAIAAGNAYLKGGSPFRALMSFEQALFDAKGMGNILLECESLSSMGILYCELGRYEDAIKKYTQCLHLQQTFKGIEHECTAQTLISLGATYGLQKKYEQSNDNYMKAIHVLENSYGIYKDVGICWLKVGDIYAKQNKFEKALECFGKGLNIIKSIDSKDKTLWNAQYSLGICYLREKRYKEALSALLNASAFPPISKDILKKSGTVIHIAIAKFHLRDFDLSLKDLTEAINVRFSKLDDGIEIESLQRGIDIALTLLKKRHGTMNVEYARLIEKKAICAAKLDDQSAALKSHTEALKIYRTVHGTSHPFVKNSLYNIGLNLNSLGKPEKARKCLQQAYKATKNLHGEENIDCAEINFHIGISYKLQENFTEAKNYFDDSINTRKIFSDDPKCLAKSFEMAGDVADSSQGAHSKYILIAEKNYKESLRLYTSVFCHRETASVNFKLANLYVRKGKYGPAIIHFEKSLVTSKVLHGTKDKLVGELYLNLGIAHDSARNFTKAIKCFDSCIEIGQVTSAKALICKGIALSKIGELNEALDSLAIAIEKTTDPILQADVHVAKGHVLDMMGKNEMAIQNYLSALSIYRAQPKNEDIVSNTCQDIANSHLKEQRFDAAQEFSDEAFEIRKKKWGIDHHLTAESLYHRGSIFFAKKEWEQALSCLNLSLFTFKKLGIKTCMKANALYMLGCSQEKLDRYDQAIESFNKALILHKEQKGPDHIDVARSLRRLGVLYKLQKDYTKSKTSLMQSLRISSECLDPSHNEVSQVHEYLAETLCRDSQHRESLLHIGKAIENYEGHGKTLDLARCHGLHGTILDQTGGNLDEVINSHKKSKELFDELLRDTRCDAQNREDFMSFASNVFKLAMAQERSGKDKTATSNYAYANRLYRKALNSNETLYHADVLQKLANLKGRQNKLDKACVLLEETLRIRIKKLGMKNESVAQALFSLGILFSKKNEYEASLKIFNDCLEIQQNTIGFDKIETADTLRAIGQCLGNTGEYFDAVNVWNEAYEIYSKHESGAIKLKALKHDLELGYRLLEES